MASKLSKNSVSGFNEDHKGDYGRKNLLGSRNLVSGKEA